MTLRVVPGGATGDPGSGGKEHALLSTRLSLSKKSAYAGEPVVMNYYLLTSGVNAALEGFAKNPSAGGFVIQQLNAEQTDEPYNEGGVQNVKTRVSSFALIPTGTGTFQVGGGVAVVSTDSPDGITFFGRALPFDSQRQVNFGTSQVSVIPLPEGAPAAFQGDVGSFSLKAEYEKGNVKVFQEKRIAVTVAGTGNFISMSRPCLEKEQADLKVIAEEGDGSYRITGDGLAGEKKFTLTVIPTKAGKVDAGSVMMTFFNPRSGAYETAKSAPVVFEATGDDSAGRMSFDSEDSRGFDFNPFLAGGVTVMAGALIALFIFWERKRMRIIRESVKSGNDGNKDEKEDDAGERILRYIETSYRADDRASFLQYADRALSLAEKSMDAHKADDETRRIHTGVKDRVYFYRYGGGTIDRAAMEGILRDVKALIQ